MKLLIITLLSVIPLFTLSQTSAPVFNWKIQEISKDNNLQGMSVLDDNTAVIAGYGGTFKISSDKGISWNDVGMFNPKYNLIDISIKGQIGYLIGRKTQLVKFPTGGEDNVYTSGVLLKTTDGGISWSQIDLSKIGDGTNPALNPGLAGCFTLNPYSVLCIDDTTALVFLQWYDITTGAKKTHSAVFKTVDGGDSWKAFTKDFGSGYITSMKMDGTEIYMGGNKILLKASAHNDSITDLFPAFSAIAGSNAFVNKIRLFPTNDLYVVTITGVFNSTDGGQTFTKINGLNGGYDLFKLDDQVKIVLGASTVSKATINGGTSWVNCFPGKACFEIPGIFNDSLYALSSSVVYKIAVNDLQSGNYKWVTQTLTTGNSNVQKMYRFDASNALIIGDDQIAKRTMDKGITWSDAVLPQVNRYDANYDFRCVSARDNAGYVTTRRMGLAKLASGESYYLNGLVYKTNDAWKTWSVLNNKNIGKDSPTDASKNPTLKGCYAMDNYTIECVDANTAYMYVGWSDTISVPASVTKHSRVFKTTNGGDLWTAVTIDFGSAIVTSIKFSGQTGYLAGNKILLKTTDGGNSFTDLYPKLTSGTDSNVFISSVVMRSVDEVYFQTSNNKGVFVTNDGGNTFSKLNGVNGGLDFIALDQNSFLSLGSPTANKFTNDGGTTWTSCNPGATIYAAGKVFNDSLYVLGKSNVYKVALSDLDLKTFTADLQSPNPLKVLYGPSELELVSADRNIDRCMVFNMSGQLLAINDPHDRVCRYDYKNFGPGIYIIAASVEGKRYTQKVIFK